MMGYTPDQFKSWQKAMGLRNIQASLVLDCSVETIHAYRKRGCSIRVMLACRALALDNGLVTLSHSFPWEVIEPEIEIEFLEEGLQQ